MQIKIKLGGQRFSDSTDFLNDGIVHDDADVKRASGVQMIGM
jgi:hypothetical protein